MIIHVYNLEIEHNIYYISIVVFVFYSIINYYCDR